MLYKVANGLVALPKDKYLTKVTRSTHQSSHTKYIPYNTKKDYFKFNFFPRTIPEWNQLDSSIAASETLGLFKSRLAKATLMY